MRTGARVGTAVDKGTERGATETTFGYRTAPWGACIDHLSGQSSPDRLAQGGIELAIRLRRLQRRRPVSARWSFYSEPDA